MDALELWQLAWQERNPDKPFLGLFTNGQETVAAHNADDARAVVMDEIECWADEVDDFHLIDNPFADLEVAYPDAIHDLRDKMPMLPKGGTVHVVARHIDWVEANGRGIVCSTEW